MKNVFKWGSIGILLFFIVTRPADAAHVVRSIGSGLATIATGVATFVTNLA